MLVSQINDLVKAQDGNKKNVDFHRHIGGGRYVSVTSGILCVDFRKFFCPSGTDEIKPTRCGVDFRFYEWSKFVEIIKSIAMWMCIQSWRQLYRVTRALTIRTSWVRFHVQNATLLKLFELSFRTNLDVSHST